MPDIKLTTCQYCGGTGEGYQPSLLGDSWTGQPCNMCEGWGQVAVKNEETYSLGPNAATYRDELGRFRSLKPAA